MKTKWKERSGFRGGGEGFVSKQGRTGSKKKTNKIKKYKQKMLMSTFKIIS